MVNDLIKEAERLATQTVNERVALIRRLSEAVDAQRVADELRTVTKRAVDGAPTEDVAAAAADIQAAVDRYVKAISQTVTDARRAARDGGWSLDQLRRLGLAKPATPRKSKSADSADPTADVPVESEGPARLPDPTAG
jgi:hypothetical protein